MAKGSIPAGIKYIIGNEAAERFSYYGLRAILTVYLATHFFNPGGDPALQVAAEARANEATHFFITLNYLMPIAGALLADWFLGKYTIILWLSLVYCLGNFLMAGFTDHYPMFMSGLVLIAVGSGGIKPCVSANVGDQFDDSNRHLLGKAFSWFYLSINFGSFFSTLFIPYLLQHFGARVAFGVPGLLMLLATLVFFMGRKKYVRVKPAGFPKDHFLGVNFYVLKNIRQLFGGQSPRKIAAQRYGPDTVAAVQSVWKVIALFAFVPAYWMLSDQSTSEWVIQATKLDLNVAGITLLPQQVQAANPVFILVLTPLFTSAVYPFLQRKGINFNEHRKILAGFVLLILSFVVIFMLQQLIDRGQHPSAAWQILAYFLQTTAEILVYLTGLEYAYAQAPASMKSTIMSFWLLTISLGNYLVSLINNNIGHKGILSRLSGASYYGFFIILMSIVAVLYSLAYARTLFSPRISGTDGPTGPSEG
ncbi:POT-type proton-dependent oligopeptide transporter [Taibaiella koreensis]|uniref:POT-type proton-dependent oligopeptide transporter n=1 Tax=Taibaiella koreensis TaxID=1268548 RepID=UPI000E59BBB7|nr:MFS transporter [Taibaiella koreensis]